MRVTFQVGAIAFEQECASRLAAWEFLAKLQEVFVPEPCGLCGGTDKHPSIRTGGAEKQYTFYEMVCGAAKCGAKLQFVKFDATADKPAAFFPQRKDKNKQWLPNRGWVKYQKEGTASQAQDTHPADQPGDGNEGGGDGSVPF